MIKFIKSVVPKRIIILILWILPSRVSKFFIKGFRPSAIGSDSKKYREVTNYLGRFGVNIRYPYAPNTRVVLFAKENQARFGTDQIASHRFGDYYFQLANFLNARESSEIGRQLQREYWANFDPSNKEKELAEMATLVGWHGRIKPKGSVIRRQSCGSNKSRLEFVGRFGLSYPVFYGVPKDSHIKGTVIALHGTFSSPDYVMAIDEKEDYSRGFGHYWVEQGWEVYAPLVNFDSAKSFPLTNCGYSTRADDLAKVEDLLNFILTEKGSSSCSERPIIVAGISYGSYLAQLSIAFFERINAAILISGIDSDWVRLRTDNDAWSAERRRKYHIDPSKRGRLWTDKYTPRYRLYFQGMGIFKLIAPKPIVISYGLHDLVEPKINLLCEISEYYASLGHENNIRLNVFDGLHESDPAGEYSAYQKLPGAG